MDFRLIDNSGEEFGTLANVENMDDDELLEECRRIISEAAEAEREAGDEE